MAGVTQSWWRLRRLAPAVFMVYYSSFGSQGAGKTGPESGLCFRSRRRPGCGHFLKHRGQRTVAGGAGAAWRRALRRGLQPPHRVLPPAWQPHGFLGVLHSCPEASDAGLPCHHRGSLRSAVTGPERPPGAARPASRCLPTRLLCAKSPPPARHLGLSSSHNKMKTEMGGEGWASSPAPASSHQGGLSRSLSPC